MKSVGPSLPCVSLAEWQTRTVSDVSLSAADRRLSDELRVQDAGGRLVVEEMRQGVRITASSWVGIVRFEQFEIRVEPKLAGDTLGLLEMLEYASNLDALRRNSGHRTLDMQGANLMDLIASLFATAVEGILRRGLLADYVGQEDELPVLRGRLLPDQQMVRRFGRIDRLVCRFDERENNVLENQILAAALSLCAVRVRHESVQQRVRRLLAVLLEVCDIQRLDLAAARSQLAYNRLNEHYRDAHKLAWLLLDALGTKDILSAGDARCFSFLLDMNRLFEAFVARMLQELCRPCGYVVHCQLGENSIIQDATTLQPYARVIPDVVIQSTGPGAVTRLPIDAKYKCYDHRKVANPDIYQCFLYAQAYGNTASQHPPLAILVYPASASTTQPLRLRVRDQQGHPRAEVMALGIFAPAVLKELRSKQSGPTLQALLGCVQSGLSRTQALEVG